MGTGLIADIVAEMAQNLLTMVEASDYEIAIYEGMLFNPSTTAIDIYPADPFRDPQTAGHGDVGGSYEFLVRARTGLNDLDSGQQILLDLMDDDSDVCVAHAIGDDPTLNGYAQDVFVGDVSGFQAHQTPDGTMVGVTWPVTVLAAHS